MYVNGYGSMFIFSEDLGVGTTVTEVIEMCQIENPGTCSVSLCSLCVDMHLFYAGIISGIIDIN